MTTGVFSVPMRDKRKIFERQLRVIQHLDEVLDGAMALRNNSKSRVDLLEGMLNLKGGMRYSPEQILNHS